jgi:hypothetical protein
MPSHTTVLEIGQQIILIVGGQIMTDSEDVIVPSKSRLMAIRQRGGPNHPMARRLRLLREALFNEHSAAFARRLDISMQRWNNFENGYPLSLDVANRIRAAAPGMTLDWLFHGDERALPLALLEKLRSHKPS